MACDAKTLIATAYANGYAALSERSLEECILAAACAGGGGGGSGGASSGAVDPTTAPSGGNGVYYNTATATFWVWDTAVSAWVKLIS